ncbi:MAG: transcription elongation factor Spt5 [Thermofilum sp.]|jgi:transcriptional antiterminator NusG|nr:transcription elongation factor Spt5 [Thermofilum sp.]MCC6058936.1 transcription elongation factor Spt5 [Thermofilum sp.]
MATEAAKVKFYALKVTAGQEYNVVVLLSNRARTGSYKVDSLIVVPGLKGMVFVESNAAYEVKRLAMGIKHVRGFVRGAVDVKEMESLLKPRPLSEQLNVGDIVEIIRGPFAGMRGRVVSVERAKNEIKVELAEAAYVLPVTISADDVKLVQRAETK